MSHSGLSVLIPVYNYTIVKLITDLHTQLTHANVAFEIRVYDDASTPDYKKKNLALVSLSQVVYHELPYNLGRSAIRNRLAEDARFQNLLFLDGDMEVVHPYYIQNYIPYLKKNLQVVIGGTCYAQNAPAKTDELLHWYAGKTKEEKNAAVRNINPAGSFTLNNMLINKELFLSIKLNEYFQTYGHEDSFFGYNLAKKRIKILHIDNFICHIGLNSASDYLQKTQSAVQNLYRMVQEYRAGTDTKLYKLFKLLNSMMLNSLFLKLFTAFEPKIKRNLLSANPSLLLLDIWKLGLYTRIHEANR